MSQEQQQQQQPEWELLDDDLFAVLSPLVITPGEMEDVGNWFEVGSPPPPLTTTTVAAVASPLWSDFAEANKIVQTRITALNKSICSNPCKQFLFTLSGFGRQWTRPGASNIRCEVDAETAATRDWIVSHVFREDKQSEQFALISAIEKHNSGLFHVHIAVTGWLGHGKDLIAIMRALWQTYHVESHYNGHNTTLAGALGKLGSSTGWTKLYEYLKKLKNGEHGVIVVNEFTVPVFEAVKRRKMEELLSQTRDPRVASDVIDDSGNLTAIVQRKAILSLCARQYNKDNCSGDLDDRFMKLYPEENQCVKLARCSPAQIDMMVAIAYIIKNWKVLDQRHCNIWQVSSPGQGKTSIVEAIVECMSIVCGSTSSSANFGFDNAHEDMDVLSGDEFGIDKNNLTEFKKLTSSVECAVNVKHSSLTLKRKRIHIFMSNNKKDESVWGSLNPASHTAAIDDRFKVMDAITVDTNWPAELKECVESINANRMLYFERMAPWTWPPGIGKPASRLFIKTIQRIVSLLPSLVLQQQGGDDSL